MVKALVNVSNVEQKENIKFAARELNFKVLLKSFVISLILDFIQLDLYVVFILLITGYCLLF